MKPKAPEWKLTIHAKSDAAGSGSVLRWLREHNLKANADYMRKLHQPEHQAVPLVIVAESAAEVLGGLLAETALSWLKISIMAVDPQFRFQGIGAALIQKAEELARTRGCKHAYVDTMCYQAPDFYLKQGYRLVGRIPDWDSHGHTKCFLTKDLEPSAAS